jgi:hypothetical protein
LLEGGGRGGGLCQIGMTLCPSPWGRDELVCINLQVSSYACGSCFVRCDEGLTCRNGACKEE